MKRCLMAAALLAMVACRSGAPAATAPIEVRGAWTRPAAPGALTAAYMVIVNHERQPVTLRAFSSPLAESMTLHETMQMSGMVHMMPLDSAQAIAAGDSLVLAEGAKHLMISGLKRALAAGDSLPFTVTFADGRTVATSAIVRAP